jgi:hypothetical protein
MEVNVSAFSRVQSQGLDPALRQPNAGERGAVISREAPGPSLQKTSLLSSAVSQSDHIAGLSQRLDKMMALLDGVKRIAPQSEKDSTITVERLRVETSVFAYSSFSSSDGAVSEQFMFQIRYRAVGGAQLAEGSTGGSQQGPIEGQFSTEIGPRTNAQGASSGVDVQLQISRQVSARPDVAGTNAPAANAGRVVEAGTEAPQETNLGDVAAETGETQLPGADAIDDNAAVGAQNTNSDDSLGRLLDILVGESQAFIERVQQLIEYYRIGGPVSEPAPDANEPLQTGEKKETPAIPVLTGEIRDGSVYDAPELEKSPVAETLDRVIQMNEEIAKRIRTGEGDDVVGIVADSARRIRTGAGDDQVDVVADRAARISTGSGDDSLAVTADSARRIRTGAGDDQVDIVADRAARISTGGGDDSLSVTAETARRINTGAGDDNVSISADSIRRVTTGAGDDTLTLTGDTIRRVDAGAGDDTINLDAEDAVISFGAGGGDDVINVNSLGALGIRIDSALATSLNDIDIAVEDDRIVMNFATGESLTVNNKNNADLISVSVGGDKVDLHVGEAPVALDAVS